MKRSFSPVLSALYIMHGMSIISGIATFIAGRLISTMTTLSLMGTLFNKKETRVLGTALIVIGALTVVFNIMLFPYRVKPKKKIDDNKDSDKGSPMS